MVAIGQMAPVDRNLSPVCIYQLYFTVIEGRKYGQPTRPQIQPTRLASQALQPARLHSQPARAGLHVNGLYLLRYIVSSQRSRNTDRLRTRHVGTSVYQKEDAIELM